MSLLFSKVFSLGCTPPPAAFRSLLTLVGTSTLAIVWLGMAVGILLSLSMARPEAALAQGGVNGTITHTTVLDFEASGNALLTGTTLSAVGGGEIRLTPIIEDYFDDTLIDTTTWITGFASPIGTGGVDPSVSGGILTLEAAYLRSQLGFTQSRRFFEARAQIVINGTEPGWPDLGFYRMNPPSYYTATIYENTSIRLFVFPNDRLPETWSRDGGGDMGSNPVEVASIDPSPVLTQYQIYRIEWEPAETRYYVNGSQETSFDGASDRASYVFLYQQDPSDTGSGRSPLRVDWVRAGYYASSGAYLSGIEDAGQVVNWTTLEGTVDLPGGTSVTFSTRTSIDNVNWSGWTAVSGNDIGSPSGRYFQYRIELATSDVLNSAEIQQVVISYAGPSSLVVMPDSATVDPGEAQPFTAEVKDDNGDAISSYSITWAVVGGGGTIDSSGTFTAGLTAGVYTNTVRATGGGLTDTATITVRDLPPVANAGGPYAGNENQPISLNGASSSDPNNGPLAFAWDLDEDGQFDDAAIPNPNYTWIDNGSYIVGLRVTDSGGLIDTVTTTVTTANVAPVINDVTANPKPDVTIPFTVTIDASDSPSDTLTYAFDWDSDGSYEVDNQTSNAASTVFSSVGSYIITARVRDQDGGEVTDTLSFDIKDRKVYLPVVIK